VRFIVCLCTFPNPVLRSDVFMTLFEKSVITPAKHPNSESLRNGGRDAAVHSLRAFAAGDVFTV
jgi:hypothetical protein